MKKKIVPYLFILPFFIPMVLLFIIPVFYSIYLSFFKYRGYGSMRFLGFGNYITIFNYPLFWKSVSNTFILWLTHIFPMLLLALLLASLVNSKFLKGKSFFRTILYLPNIMAIAVAALIFRVFFSTNSGVVNYLFNINYSWLQNSILIKIVVIFMQIWRSTGWYFVVFLAGLVSIDPYLCEAAEIDGANWWQMQWKIIIPQLKPLIFFGFVLESINSIKLFEEAWVLSAENGPPPETIMTITNFMYFNLANGNLGYAAAVGVILFIILSFFSYIAFRSYF